MRVTQSRLRPFLLTYLRVERHSLAMGELHRECAKFLGILLLEERRLHCGDSRLCEQLLYAFQHKRHHSML
jgi:hypothetical protein